jgi:hypothetical protein
MNFNFKRGALLAPFGLLLLSGCTRDGKFQPVDMWNGARLKPYEQVNFFDTRTVAQGPPRARSRVRKTVATSRSITAPTTARSPQRTR